MLAHPETYEDAQVQSVTPIESQAPIPPGVHDIELSWDRHRGYMRVIIEGQKYWFKEYLGKAQVLSCDNKRGRLNLRAMAQIHGETLTMWRDPTLHPMRRSRVSGERKLTTASATGDSPRNGGCVTSVWTGTTLTPWC